MNEKKQGYQEGDKKSVIDNKIKSTIDWLTSLDLRVAQGLITNDRKKQLIAGSMVAGELFREKADEKSKRDPMTGLLNKGAYHEEVEKLIQIGLPFGLLIIDINYFKAVNDTHGHIVGDDILVQTARNLTSSLRQVRADDKENDKVFRYGGDEFVILLPGVSKEADLMVVAERLRTSVGDSPYSVKKDSKDINIPVTVSIGGGINRQEQAETFFHKIDTQGLYEAKKNGRDKTIIVPA